MQGYLLKQTLSSGHKVDIDELEVSRSHRGLFVGSPRVFTFGNQRPNWAPKDKGLLVLDHTPIEYTHHSGATRQRSPEFVLAGTLFSKIVKDQDHCYSALRVVWPIETLPDNQLYAFAEAIVGIDWEANAVDVSP